MVSTSPLALVPVADTAFKHQEPSPAATRNGMPASKPERKARGIGGQGGVGQGLQFGKPLASIADDARANVEDLRMYTTDFCREYCLGVEIDKKLDDAGFSRAGDLLEVSDVILKKAGFKIGHIAELTWAMKKLVGIEYKEPSTIMPENLPDLYGEIDRSW
jgi:hypothetical protein